MSNLIACRVASYGRFQERAWQHLPEIGVRFVEIPVPAPGETAAVRQRLADSGLRASSLQCRCDITSPNAVESMKPQLQACAELGARVCFLSLKAGDADRAAVFRRIAALGDEAAKLDLLVAMETHPDLVSNGDVAAETMKAVDHPRVGVNYDTANVYYYNRGVDGVEELKKIVDYVVSVHLKETNGQYQDWHFPALGRGIVNFPEIFSVLNARGFTGPFTLELEGIKGVELDEAGHLAEVAGSVAYLRGIGAM